MFSNLLQEYTSACILDKYKEVQGGEGQQMQNGGSHWEE